LAWVQHVAWLFRSGADSYKEGFSGSNVLAVLFDLEGTLVETRLERNPEEVQELRRETRRTLLEMGVPEKVLGDEVTSIGMRNLAFRYARENLGNVERARLLTQASAFMELHESRLSESYRLYPETTEALDALHNAGARLAIVTNTTRKSVGQAFSNFGLERYFDAVVSREDVSMLKPDPEGTLLALRLLGWTPGSGRFHFVGDTRHDVLAARNAGGISIGVDRGLHRLDEVAPDHRVRSLTQVVSIVATNTSSRRTSSRFPL